MPIDPVGSIFDDEEPSEEGSISDVYKARVRAALEGHAARVVKQAESTGTGPKRYSTQACIDWGRQQGWRLLDRERYDVRTKRHHDLFLGADAMFESDEGLVLVQGAGKSERGPHRKRFEDRGGIERCKKLSCRFFYLEFERFTKEPVKLEVWS